MRKKLLKDSFAWGFILWLIGYILSFVLFLIVPLSMIGWIIAPIGTGITLFVIYKKFNGHTLHYYAVLGFCWLCIAMVLDYVFIVKLLNPANYYKPSVYLYYILTFGLPVFVWRIQRKRKQEGKFRIG